MKHKNTKNETANKRFQIRRAIVACLILCSMMICLTASPITQTQLASKLSAQPSDIPLNEEQLAELVERLKEVLAESVEDEDTQTSITEKWDARMGSLAGKTAKQVTNLLLADVKSVVKDAAAISALTEGFTAAATDAEPTAEPKPEPDTETETKPEPDNNKPKTPSTNPTQPTGRPGTNAQLRQYIRSLNYDPRTLMSVAADGGTLLVEKVTKQETDRTPGNRKITRCTRKTTSLSRNFENIAILQPTHGVVYPGALVFADEHLVDGKPRPMNGLPRAPIDLRVDLPGMQKEGSFTIANPTDGKVESALNKSLNVWNNSTSFKDGYVNAARSSYDSTVAYSSEQLALGLGFNVKWATGDAAAQFKFASSSEKNVVVAVYKQVFYTVKFDAPNTPEAFFDASVTPEEAKEVFSSTAEIQTKDKLVPAYVSSVNYGRIIMLRMETDKDTTKADLEATAKYVTGTVSVSVNAETHYNKIIANSQITVITMGGNAEVASQAVSAKSAEDLAPIIKGKNSRYSKDNPGVPIGYTVKFLKDDVIAKMGTTTEYTTNECKDLANLWIVIRQNGAYMADFTVTWDDPGKPTTQKKEERLSAGNKMQVDFPADATNIRVNLRTMSGWGILDKVLLPDDLSKCYQTTGHAIGPGWDNKCER